MNKLIITYDDDIDPLDVLRHVKIVIIGGRISKNETSFCACSVFHLNNDEELIVLADRTQKGTDTLKVFKQLKQMFGTSPDRVYIDEY